MAPRDGMVARVTCLTVSMPQGNLRALSPSGLFVSPFDSVPAFALPKTVSMVRGDEPRRHQAW